MFFAGIWREWDGDRGTKTAPDVGKHLVFSFLTTDASPDVAPIHPDATPVLLLAEAAREQWMNAPMEEALLLQKAAAGWGTQDCRRRYQAGHGMTAIVEWLAGEVLDAAWQEVARRIFKRRLDVARKILIEELNRGTANITDIEDKDEAAAMVFEFAASAERGTARRNLRMIAQVLAGALTTPPIYADEFLRWSRILAELTQSEIVTLATFHKAHCLDESELPPAEREAPSAIRFQVARDELIRMGAAKDELEVRATLQALGRYGLVLQQSGWGGIVYHPAANLRELMNLVRINEVLAEPIR